MSKSGQQDKSFTIPKQLVWEAYKRVKANKGAAGVDLVSMERFEEDLRGNLYKIWNRMSSGTYFPPPVKAVEIPKSHGGTRILGVPTVGDRIAQTVVALQLEARTESIFHPDSYGYRPGKSAHDALAKCRQRCWEGNWVVDLDIEKFFDSLDHDLVVKTVEANTDQKWVLLYVKRWLKAPLQMPDGTLRERDRGTPQGSAVSPVLANLFLHYAMDSWLEREFPAVEFERSRPGIGRDRDAAGRLRPGDRVPACVTTRSCSLLARLGLRGAEAAGLRLDDVDWRAGEIAVTGKGSRVERLPLPAPAGEALAAWLTVGGTQCESRAVFVTVRRPYRPLTPEAVRSVMGWACERAGLERRGAHRFRHALATEMLRAGASLPEVGQVLRHRSMLSTSLYAKVDQNALRPLARPWPGSTA